MAKKTELPSTGEYKIPLEVLNKSIEEYQIKYDKTKDTFNKSTLDNLIRLKQKWYGTS